MFMTQKESHQCVQKVHFWPILFSAKMISFLLNRNNKFLILLMPPHFNHARVQSLCEYRTRVQWALCFKFEWSTCLNGNWIPD